MLGDKDKAYLLGALKGDGCANYYYYGKGKQHYLIQFFSSRREFVDSVMEVMRALGIKPRIGSIRKTGYNKKPQIAIQGNNKAFVMWYLHLSYNEMVKWLIESKKRIIAFLKGFYEADGSKRKKNSLVRFSNSDKQLLLVVKHVLEFLGFNPTIGGGIRKSRPKNKPEYVVRLNRLDESKEFLFLTKPCIKGGV